MNTTKSISIFRRVTSVGVVSIALLGSVVFSGCTQQERKNISETARAMSGIDRTIRLYAADGSVIREWRTKTGIGRKGTGVDFLDADGSRVIFNGTFTVEESK